MQCGLPVISKMWATGLAVGGKAQLRWPEQSLVCLSARPSSTATYLTTHPLTHLGILSLTLPQLQASVSSGVARLAQL